MFFSLSRSLYFASITLTLMCVIHRLNLFQFWDRLGIVLWLLKWEQKLVLLPHNVNEVYNVSPPDPSRIPYEFGFTMTILQGGLIKKYYGVVFYVNLRILGAPIVVNNVIRTSFPPKREQKPPLLSIIQCLVLRTLPIMIISSLNFCYSYLTQIVIM